jgi:hypothetical protein
MEKKGHEFAEKGDIENAIDSFHKVIELSPQYAKGYYYLGNHSLVKFLVKFKS